jgi:hypothetical protein
MIQRNLLLSFRAAAFGAIFLWITGNSIAQESKPDPWASVRFMVGEWNGISEGEPGSGTVHRTYEFILKNRFLHEHNVSTYPPQDSNQAGEVHEHLGFISYDRARKSLVFRQFHQEGFVNQYALNADSSSATRLVFDSEHFENFDNTWRARETYDLISADEFVETFELGPPGDSLQVYSRNHFKRVKP